METIFSMVSIEVRLLTLQFVYVLPVLLERRHIFCRSNRLRKKSPPLTLVAIFRPRHHFNSANWVGGRGADRGALKGGERNGRTWSRPGNIGHLVLEEESPHWMIFDVQPCWGVNLSVGCKSGDITSWPGKDKERWHYFDNAWGIEKKNLPFPKLPSYELSKLVWMGSWIS